MRAMVRRPRHSGGEAYGRRTCADGSALLADSGRLGEFAGFDVAGAYTDAPDGPVFVDDTDPL